MTNVEPTAEVRRATAARCHCLRRNRPCQGLAGAAGRQNVGMNVLFDFTRQTGLRIAEVGFLLILIAGVWLAASVILNPERWGKFRTIVVGVLLAIAGALLIIATHWGHFG